MASVLETPRKLLRMTKNQVWSTSNRRLNMHDQRSRYPTSRCRCIGFSAAGVDRDGGTVRLAGNLCEAGWRSNSGGLPHPGIPLRFHRTRPDCTAAPAFSAGVPRDSRPMLSGLSYDSDHPHILMRSSSHRSCGGARSWTSAPSASGAASRRSSPGPPPAPATDSDSDSDSDCAPAPVPSAACLARARCAIRHRSTIPPARHWHGSPPGESPVTMRYDAAIRVTGRTLSESLITFRATGLLVAIDPLMLSCSLAAIDALMLSRCH
jgi:hypothetical protein